VLAEKQTARRGSPDREWDEVFHAGPMRKNRTLPTNGLIVRWRLPVTEGYIHA
jgi:hypothetical protein